MKKIVLLRHGESVWNRENRFTGWTDVDLSEKGVAEAVKAGETLRREGFHFGRAYTSYLKRAVKTLDAVLDAGIPDASLPRTESLKDTVARTMPYWECEILPALARHDELLVVAHGNSLRGIIKNLKGISDEAISEFNLPTAVPYVFEFDEGLGYVKDYFLGDPAEIAKLMEAVANQGKA